MLFLIEYDRRRGCIVTFRTFMESEREAADNQRIALELDRHREGTVNEVVVLEASSENALRRTHRRYFEDVGEIAATRTPGKARS